MFTFFHFPLTFSCLILINIYPTFEEKEKRENTSIGQHSCRWTCRGSLKLTWTFSVILRHIYLSLGHSWMLHLKALCLNLNWTAYLESLIHQTTTVVNFNVTHKAKSSHRQGWGRWYVHLETRFPAAHAVFISPCGSLTSCLKCNEKWQHSFACFTVGLTRNMSSLPAFRPATTSHCANICRGAHAYNANPFWVILKCGPCTFKI